MDVVEVAREIATRAHAGQFDKSGHPYLGHPERVAARTASAGGDERAVAAAWLHDVLEDTAVTADELASAGIPDDVIEAVVALTKLAGQDTGDYFARVNSSPIAVRVKHADLDDNTDPARVAQLDPGTRRRLAAKYARSRELLAAVD